LHGRRPHRTGGDTMPSAFDLIYYGLSIVMLGLMSYTIVAGVALQRTIADPLARREAAGVGLAAIGAFLTLVGGVVFLDLFRARQLTGLHYQQVQFVDFYVAFALFLHGVLATARRWPLLVWLGFVVAVVIASVFLFNPNSYTYTHSGSRINAVQQLVFWVPLFYVTAVGILLLPFRVMHGSWHPLWFAFCCATLLAGLLRESTIIPSLGSPELDLLVAFLPFLVATFCLFMTVRTLAGERTAMKGSTLSARNQ
jgi:hypothetical protein